MFLHRPQSVFDKKSTSFKQLKRVKTTTNGVLNFNFSNSAKIGYQGYFQVMEDWKFVAMVIDRLFLVLFSLACCLGTTTIICQAPTLYDQRQPIDEGNQYEVHALNGVLYCNSNSWTKKGKKKKLKRKKHNKFVIQTYILIITYKNYYFFYSFID